MLIVSVATIPLEDFYSFGSEHGDDVLSANDDGSTEEIQLSVSFPFFDRDHNSLFVSKVIIIISSYTVPQTIRFQNSLLCLLSFYGNMMRAISIPK